LKLDSSFCPSALDSNGQTIWIVDAHRDDGRRFIVHAAEKLSAFLELERAIHEVAVDLILITEPPEEWLKP